MPNVELLPVNGGLALISPFDRDFLDAFKASTGYSERKWDAASKRWIIAPSVAPTVAQLVMDHFGVALTIPASAPVSTAPQARIITVEYVGRCQPRDNGDVTASGFCDGSWSIVFPEAVLRAWFQADSDPEEPETVRRPTSEQTFYQVLTLKQTADADAIKKAYRQLARQWHPDVCSEPDAADMFRRIKHAYEILSDEQKRKRYNAGLVLETSLKANRPKNMERHRHDDDVYGYRSPLRCGFLLVQGVWRVGQFVVSQIYQWSDVVRDDGKTMVSSWSQQTQSIHTQWV